MVPMYCETCICTSELWKIKGRLTQPVQLFPAPVQSPEGILTPSCLRASSAGSTRPWESPWSITHFLWQSTTLLTDIHGSIGWPMLGLPQALNRTLQVVLSNSANGVTASCTFNDRELDQETDRWWPCFRDHSQEPHRPPLQRTVETWVQFSAKTGRLRINQTWYCADVPPLQTPFVSCHPLAMMERLIRTGIDIRSQRRASLQPCTASLAGTAPAHGTGLHALICQSLAPWGPAATLPT